MNLKLAFRALWKTPFVTTVAVISLALGIGANAAIFTLFNQILVRPLPVDDPYSLVNFGATGPKPGSQSCNQQGTCEEVMSYQMFRDLERVQNAFVGIAAHRLQPANVAYGGQTLNGEMMVVSGSYFPLLGIQPALGRLLGPQDDRTIGESPVAVVSYEWWETKFGADPSMVGRTIIVNGQALTVVGVGPRGFRGTTVLGNPCVFIPITMRGVLRSSAAKAFDDRTNYWAFVFGRLKPGVTIDKARSAINVQYHGIINEVEASLQTDMSAQTMKRFRAKPLIVTPGAKGQSVVGEIAAAPMTMLMGVTLLVLLIACANIANLLLVRGATRGGEMAVRLSIGAGRRHLLAQLLTEAALLAVLGAAAGLVVANWTLHLTASLLSPEARQVIQLNLDGTVLLFTACLALGTGLLFGLFPALHATRPDLASTLKGQAGQPSGGRSTKRFRTVLATSQIALSMALLVCAGLFTRSLFNISRVDLGIQTENVVGFTLSPALNGYKQQASKALFQRVEDQLRVMPGVTSVSAAEVPLLSGNSWGNDVSVEGFDAGPDTDVNCNVNAIGTGYFRTLGVPLLAGREFTEADAGTAPKVAIVNEAFMKKFNMGRNAVGRRMAMNRGKKLDIEIVGVVKDAKYSQVKQRVPPVYFIPYRQDDPVGTLSFYVRTSLDPAQAVAAIPRLVARIDPNLPVQYLGSLPDQVRQNVFMDRFITVLSAAFACLATLLAAIGLYGVLAFTVAQRTRELGLRMALGAAPERVRGLVLKQVGWMTLVGGVIGLAAAVMIGRAAQSQELLFGLKGYDPLVMAGAAIALTLVAFAAGFVPAQRASHIDPMTALRYE